MRLVSGVRAAAARHAALKQYASGHLERLQLARALERCSRYSMISPERLSTLYLLQHDLNRRGLRGDIVECGVCNGGTAGILAYACRRDDADRHLHLFDSFQGLPEPNPLHDGQKALSEYHPGMDLGSADRVRELMGFLGVQSRSYTIVQGWFEATLPSYRAPEVALLHIDADWYESVLLCLQTFYAAVRPGGVRKATDEFLTAMGLNVELVEVDYTARYFHKPDLQE